MIDAHELKSMIHYNSDTGDFTWKSFRGGTACANSVAGSIDTKGYRQIKIYGRLYLAHRLTRRIIKTSVFVLITQVESGEFHGLKVEGSGSPI